MFMTLNQLIDKYVTHVPQYDEETVFCERCGFAINEGDTYYRYGRFVPKVYCEECRDFCLDEIEYDIEEYDLEEEAEAIIARCAMEMM